MSRFKIISLFLFLQCLFCLSIKAQTEYSLLNINVDKGLNQSTINTLIIDKKGFIWAGTQDGLSKFDGYTFVTYRHNPKDTTSISSNSIQGICEDENQNLWISTEIGFNKLLRLQDKFASNLPNLEKIIQKSSPNINDMVMGRNNILWLKLENHLVRYNIKLDSINYFDIYNDPFNLVSDISFNGMIEDSNGNIWIPTKDGLYFFDTKLEQVKHFKPDIYDQNSISTIKVRVAFEDSRQNIYIGTDEGLVLYNQKKKCFITYKIENKDIGLNIITTIFEDNEGIIILGTKSGLVYFDVKNKTLSQKIIKHIAFNNLNIKKVTKIVQENNGTYWIGTENDGIYKLDKLKKKFGLINHENKNIKLPTEDIAAIYEASDKKLWIGTLGQGLVINNPITGITETYDKENKRLKLPDNFIHVIFNDKSNRKWIGTRNGLVIFNESKKIFESLTTLKIKENIIFKNNKINCIYQDNEGTIWVGTQNGLIVLKNSEFKMFKITHPNELKTSQDEVRAIIQTKDNKLWIGTQKGIVIINLKDNNKKFHRKLSGSSSGLSNNSVRCIYEDKDGIVWVGTDSGLNKYDPKSMRFSYFNQSDGFINDFIYDVLEDKNRNLWMGTNHGLARLNKDSQRIRCFDTYDGLQDYEFNFGASFKASDDKMYFGGPKGLNYFYPDSINQNALVPRITLTSIILFYKNGEIKKSHADNLEEVFIPNDVYMFNLEFAALDFNRSEKNLFQYKIDNEQENWITLRNQHVVSFNGLSKGVHYISITGSNNDECWNNEGIKVKVLVDSTIWNNNWSYGIYAFLVISLILLIVRIRTKQLSKENQLLIEKNIFSKEAEARKLEVETQNLNITDSMHYAQRIISAMTPSERVLKRSFKDFFVLYQPKDIVSGDFYWFGEIGDKIAIAAIDCTGHGIPGAFMSIIGLDLLRNISKDKSIENPAEILNLLNKGVTETFKDNEESQVNDGMDLAFCMIDRKNKILEYAGAFNPVYIIRDNNIIIIKGDRFAVGAVPSDASFVCHTFNLQEEDVIYIFSDGYIDQFGGPEGKKLKSRRFRHILLNIYHLPMEEQKAKLKTLFENWKGPHVQIDDVLVIGLRPLK